MARRKSAGAQPVVRPFQWTDEIEAEIFERIAKGEAIRKICGPERDDWLPSWPTMNKRLADDKAFAARYAQAREAQADTLFDEILQIADDGQADYDGEGAFVAEHVQRSKLKIEARKWMAGKLRPKVYGDKIDLMHTGPDGGPIQTVTRRIIDADRSSD